jgi:hypothetical protein
MRIKGQRGSFGSGDDEVWYTVVQVIDDDACIVELDPPGSGQVAEIRNPDPSVIAILDEHFAAEAEGAESGLAIRAGRESLQGWYEQTHAEGGTR